LGRTLIIAEAGVNHDGSIATALELVDVAADSGADIVKFQTFDIASLATATAPQAAYQRERAAASGQLEMLEHLHLDRDAHDRIAERCAERGIEFLSTAFDLTSLAWLRDLGIRRVKVPSGELTNGPLLLTFARTGLPLLVSTGMATLADVEQALAVIAFGRERDRGEPTGQELRSAYHRAMADGALRQHVTLLHCTSSYPAPPESVNLTAIDTLSRAFTLPVGYSDHTLGTAVAVAAVARGATVLEKHLTLDRSRPGPDHAVSIEPRELVDLVADIRTVETALGEPVKYPTPDEWDTMVAARRSIVAARPIAAGETFDETNLAILRPGDGRSPMDHWKLLGRRASRAYTVHEAIADSE
jgi:N-acetylneuraminate synthase